MCDLEHVRDPPVHAVLPPVLQHTDTMCPGVAPWMLVIKAGAAGVRVNRP